MSLDRRTLRVEFSTDATFRSEYLSNISNGGVFIATSERLDVRDPVVVVLELSWCGESVELEGEVVHRIGEDMAEAGAIPGVAVQLDLPAREIRERLAPLVGSLDGNERVTRSGKRAAPRSPARIAVQLQTGDGRDVRCRTRDISTTGILVSLHDESPLPIGEEVGLTILHPTSGERMEVNGAVVRHLVTEDGIVTALGIELRTSAARRTEITSFMNDIRAEEHRRRLGGITGPVADLGIGNLLQMFGASSPRGTLTVTRGAEEGIIVFDAGRLHTVRLGRDTGRDALRELMSWGEGTFEFHARIDGLDLEGDGEGEDVALCAAILDAMRTLDEQRRPGRARPDEGASGGPVAEDDVPDVDLDLDLGLGLDPGFDSDDVDLDSDDADLDGAMRGGAGRDGAPARKVAATRRTGAPDARTGRREGGAPKLDPSLLPPRKQAASRTADEPARGGAARPAAGGGRKPAAPVPRAVDEGGKRDARPAARAATPKAAAKRGSAPGGARAVRITQETRFHVDDARADATRSELGKVEQAVLDLAVVGMAVGRMVDVIPESELDVYRALDALIELEVLRARSR